MRHRFFIRILYLILIYFSYSSASFAVEKKDKDNPQAYIELAISKQKSDPDAANRALEQAYYLAKKQNNTPLIAKTLLEQGQMAKLHKDYFLAQQYLSKAEGMLSQVEDNTLAVDILTNMSSIQRSLKHYDRSMDYVQKALAIARESRKTVLIFKCLQVKGTLLKKTKRYDDSLTTYLSAQRYMSDVSYLQKVKLLRDIAGAYSKVNEHESSIRYYKKAVKILEDNNDIKNIPHTLIDVSKEQAKIGDFSNALANAKRSVTLAREYKDEKFTLKSLVVLSILYRKLSSYEEALLHGLEALEIYNKNKDLDGAAAASNSLGLIYAHLEQTDNAKSYFTDVVNMPPEKINGKYRAAALRGLGKLIFAEHKGKQGVELANEALTIYEKIGDRNGVATVQKNMGYIYHEMGNLPESINAYNMAIKLFQKMGDVWNESETKAHLAIILVDKNTKRAIELAQSSLDQSTKIGAKSISEQAYSALVLAEEKLKNYQQALIYAKKKEALVNEIKTDSINKRLAEIHIVLNVEKKERAFEALKREKAVISLELDNKETRLSLLEKEKTISDLKTKNTLIILSVTSAAVILCLFVLGRIYFNMQYRFIVSIVIVLALLLYSFNSNATDIIKLTQAQSNLDVRPKYTHAILKQALEFSLDKYGSYEIKLMNQSLTNEKQILEVHEGTHINLTMAMTSPDWEYLALPIRIPIRRGVGSYRLLTINKKNQENFKNITSLEDLKHLTVGLQKGWIINDLLEEEEGFKVIEGLTYDGLFRMLNKNRFDYIPRGIHEAYDEISLRESKLQNLMIEPNLAIHIPQPYYIFVSPKYPRIAERIEYGLEKMIAQGVLQKMFDEHYSEFIKKANLASRTIINMGNKYLTRKTPVDRKELWLKFDLEKNQ